MNGTAGRPNTVVGVPLTPRAPPLPMASGANGIASTEIWSPRVGSMPAAAETALRIFWIAAAGTAYATGAFAFAGAPAGAGTLTSTATDRRVTLPGASTCLAVCSPT